MSEASQEGVQPIEYFNPPPEESYTRTQTFLCGKCKQELNSWQVIDMALLTLSENLKAAADDSLALIDEDDPFWDEVTKHRAECKGA